MSDDKLIPTFLEITSWVGTSVGAEHCYGTLRCRGETKKLTNKMSYDEAVRLNKKAGMRVYKVGEETIGFDSRDDIIKLAKRTFRRMFPESSVLILGNASYAEPQKVIVGPSDIKDAINSWYNEAEKIGWYDGGNKSRMYEISDEFYEFWKENFKR